MAMNKLVGAAVRRPGWADLPRDLLESVLGRLPVPDRLRFPGVCTAWQSADAASTTARFRAAQPPWLMLPFNPTARRQSSGGGGGGGDGRFLEARFLSLSDGRVYAIPQPAPPVSERLCVGSSDGWLVTADAASELHLLNPLTGAQVQLPSVTTLPFVDASRDADGRVASYDLRCCFGDGDNDGDEVLVPPESFAPDRLRYELYEKAILVAPPRRQTTPPGSWGGYAVLLICQPLYRLAIARAGDTKWTLLDTPSRCWVDAVRASSAPAAADGHQAVYTLDSVGRVEAWDMDGGADVLAGRALFLGKSASLCVPADCCPEVKGNCVYFTDDGPWSHERCHEVVPDVGVLDLADGSYKLPRGAVRDLLWKWPPPVWVFPSCTN
uniref:F-box domain-containing protein n=1 Tax=Oryza meridionalis TaxID=40149 RepID=A0A0E0E655_9ORYZ